MLKFLLYIKTVKTKKNSNIPLPAKEGEIVEGKVINLSGSALFLDLGAKGTGIIYGREFAQAKDIIKDAKSGDSIWAKVIELDNNDGYIELSVAQARSELVWKELEEKKQKEENIKVKILGANKGGLLAEVSGIPAFLPVSQLSAELYPKVEGGDKLKILRELQKLVGRELEVKIIDLEPKQRKLILSEKARGTAEIKKALENYKVGDVVEGKITALTDFGAFIAFPLPAEAQEAKARALPAAPGGSSEKAPAKTVLVEGLIHISELDWQAVKDPADVLQLEQTVKAKIIEINDSKVALSLKALQPRPQPRLQAV